MTNKDPSPGIEALMDPTALQEPVVLEGWAADTVVQFLRDMFLIRAVEAKLAEGRRSGVIGGPVHLGAGQEAVAVGVSSALVATDRVFSAHRSHGHALALGSNPRSLLAEVLGRETGLSRGMGGSMHLWDKPQGFWGSVPIVAGTVPIAVGAGLAAMMQGLDAVAVSYFGDGAVEEGVVFESLNLASVLQAPVLFVCENNMFASHMHVTQRQPFSSMARHASAHGIPARVVDGNDVIAVASAAEQFTAQARSGGGPGFLEAFTYRQYGHVDWRDDIDVGVNRSQSDLQEWRKRDPITRLTRALVAAGHLTSASVAALQSGIVAEVESAWEQALIDPYPHPDSTLSRVYAR